MTAAARAVPWDYLLGSVHSSTARGRRRASLVAAVGVEEAWRPYFVWLRPRPQRAVRLARPPRPGQDLRHAATEARSTSCTPRWRTRSRRRLRRGLAAACTSRRRALSGAELLDLCHERGVPITLASDATVPQHVGRDSTRPRARSGGRLRDGHHFDGRERARSRSDERVPVGSASTRTRSSRACRSCSAESSSPGPRGLRATRTGT